MNPNPYGTGLKLNISENDNSLDFDLASNVASFFRLIDEEAVKIIKNTKEVVSKWKNVASKCQIPKQEQDMMASSFKY
jgi:serine/threonine-protein kinase HipA